MQNGATKGAHDLRAFGYVATLWKDVVVANFEIFGHCQGNGLLIRLRLLYMQDKWLKVCGGE